MAETAEPGTPEVTAPGEVRVRRALLTVSDKRGLVDFARGLVELGVEIVSTGGTARELAGAGIETRSVEGYTGFPEMLDGRVKTLNPRIYAGLLAVRSEQAHVDTLREQEIEPIDLVCVNLYPFEQVAGRRGVSEQEAIENIDIGGPTLIRASAKNHAFAAVVVTPESYDAVLEELRAGEGRLETRTREALAMEAFSYTARYDAAISRWFAEREDDFPGQQTRSFTKVLDLAYGENPHQRAAYYAQARRAHAPAVDGVEAPRQGAVVQQPARPRLGPQARRRVRGPGGGDHQAQQPVRRGCGHHRGGGFRARSGHRPDERLRRRDGLQPPGRP